MIKTELTVAVSGLKKAKNEYGLIGICDLVFSGLFAVRCVRIQCKNGHTMLRFPFRLTEDKLDHQTRLLDVCHPLTGEFRKELTELVGQEWQKKFGQPMGPESEN